jgi:hypothetical protein
MAQVNVAQGIELELPEGVAAQQRPVGTGGRRGERVDTVDAALIDADYTVEAVIELTPVPARRGAPPTREAAVEPVLRVDVAANQGAVALLESEGGLFAWLMPEESKKAVRRGHTGRTLEFPLANAVPAKGTATEIDRRGRRGIVSWIGNKLLEPIRIRVLTFAANLAIDKLMDAIEGGRDFGLVNMSGPVSSWKPGAKMPKFAAGKPARILLMVHGTFSSSAGSFGALELTTAGKIFLDRAQLNYSAVLGFDHKTLAEDPEQNARAILDELKSLPKDCTIDAVGFSRGGLVLRTLAERLAPQERPDLKFDRIIFVGCTNAGTHLAEPDNWGALVDLYTNIVTAGARAIALLSANFAAEMVASGVSAIGRFVKYIPEIAIKQNKVPGLSAMEPDGELVRALNGAEPGLDGPAYHVIATDFEPRIEPSKGITGEVAEYLIDRVVDRFFQGIDNDLVVDTESMWTFGKHGDRLGDEARVLIPSEESVYHTIYFGTERVGQLLADWLRPASTGRIMNDPGYLPQGGEGGLPEPSIGGDAVDLSHTGFDTGIGGIEDVDGGIGGFEDLDGGGAPDVAGVDGLVPLGGDRRGRGVGGRRGGSSLGFGIGTRGRFRTAARAPAAAPEPPKAEAPPAESIACHFAAEMQPTPVIGLPVPLFVTVSPERIGVAAGPTASTTEAAVAVDKMKQIEIEVIPSKSCRIFGVEDAPPSTSNERKESPSLRFIDVPTKGAVSLRFEIEGTAPGEAEIFIEARQESRLLASFLLKPVFTMQADARISASQIAHPTFAGPDDPAVLRIYEMHMANEQLRLRFELSCEEPNIFVQEDVDLRPSFNLGAFVAGFLTMLEDAYDLKNYDDILDEITSFSIARTQELIPERVRRALWEHREEIKAIQVISEEPLIPWELLYIADPTGQSKDRQGFLAEWGLVRWMYNASWPTRKLSLRGERTFHVVPDYLNPDDQLKGAAEERQMLTNRFPGATALEPKSREVRKFLREKAAECDLLHFACHGLAEQKAVLSSDLIMKETQNGQDLIEDRLTQDHVKVEAAFGEGAPAGMVFINACQTGRPGEGIAGVMGFADSFIRPMTRQGVTVLVGALWSVSDTLALTFADTFYDQLNRGETLVAATRAAREACKDKKDFTWLAYSLYGHPFARVVK